MNRAMAFLITIANPSGHAISPRVSPASEPATTSGDTTSFPFKLNTYTALLTTTDTLSGDLSAKTLHVTVSVIGGSGMVPRSEQRRLHPRQQERAVLLRLSEGIRYDPAPVRPASTRDSGGRTQ